MKPRRSIKPPSASISADVIRIVAQTLPDSPILRPEVASLLAQDVEFYMRHVIHIAKKHMRHSKSFRLSLEHLQAALKAPLRENPSFGFSASVKPPPFHAVDACPGLHVYADSVIPLDQILQKPLPIPRPSFQLVSSMLIVPSRSFTVRSSLSAQDLTAPIVQAVIALLSSSASIAPHSTAAAVPDLDSTLFTLNSAPTLPLQILITLIREAVAFHAQPDGDNRAIQIALRMLMALVSRSTYGVEIFEDCILRIICTCLLARNLSPDYDPHSVRMLAVEVLYAFLALIGDYNVRQRVCNTLNENLIDANSSLGSVYGAILGLAALGRRVFQPIVVPLLPQLVDRLGDAVQLSTKTPPDVANRLQCDVVHLWNAVDSGMQQCYLYYPENLMLDVFL